jgi:ketol-acid reductoisomerase
MNVVISDTAEYGNYLFTHAAVPLLQDHVNSLTLEDLGEGLSDPSNAVDNIRLIQVNDAIRDHDVEIIGHELRGYMTDMKSIAESSNA